MKHCILLLSLLIALPGMAQLGPGFNALSINNRDFDVITPADYDISKTYPIVFELHGLGQDKDDMDD